MGDDQDKKKSQAGALIADETVIHEFHKTEAGPEYYPREIMSIENFAGKDITIGDLHGNTMAMVHYLVKIGLLKLSEAQYLELNKNYNIVKSNNLEEPKQLNQAINRFIEIISQAEVLNPGWITSQQPLIRFMGDMLCDRGANDFLTLHLLSRLRERDIDYSIIWSNHDALFLQEFYRQFVKPEGFEDYTHSLLANPSYSSFYNSLISMLKTINNPGISAVLIESVKGLVDMCYIPNLTIIDYEHREQGSLDIFTHAPICLSQIVGEPSVIKMLENNGVNIKNLLNDSKEFTKAVDVIDTYFKSNLGLIIKALNTYDRFNTNLDYISELQTKGVYSYSEFKKITGVDYGFISLLDNILANQRYDRGLLTYYATSHPEITFAHSKINGHDDELSHEEIQHGCRAIKANPTLIEEKLSASLSLNSMFGNAMVQPGLDCSAEFISSLRHEHVPKPRKISTAPIVTSTPLCRGIYEGATTRLAGMISGAEKLEDYSDEKQSLAITVRA